VIDDLDVDSPEVARFLAELRALPEACGPTPSGELAALLALGLLVPPAPAGVPHRKVAGVSAAVLVAALTGTGWAAAANELPGPVQDVIADLFGPLPFHVPHSSERDGSAPDGSGPNVESYALPADQPARAHRSRASAPEADDVVAHDTAPTGAGTVGNHDPIPDPAPVAHEGDTYGDGPDEDENQAGTGQPGGGTSNNGDGDAGEDHAADPDKGDPSGAGQPGGGPPGGGPPGGGPLGGGPPGGGPPEGGPPEGGQSDAGPPDVGPPDTRPPRPPTTTPRHDD
jgi:hypothetical protein